MKNLFELVAILSLDNSKYLKGLDDSEKKAKGFGSKLAGGLGKMAKVGGAALAAAGTASVAFTKKSIDAGREFDNAISQVAATMGKSTAEMESEVGKVDLAWGKFSGNLREYAQEMGEHTMYSATQSAEALNYMALAGYNAQESMEMLPNVLNLAAAGAMDLGTASDMVTDAQTALGLSFKETTQMTDQMAKAASTTNQSVQQFGEGILQVGANARSIKGGTAELTQILGLLADNSIKGSEGGTHLRNIMLRFVKMQNPTKKMAAAMEELGISANDFYDKAGNLRELPDIFEELQEKTKDMTQQQRDSVISRLFNTYDLKAVNALLGTSQERWKEVRTAIDSAAEGGVLYQGKLYGMEEAQKKWGDSINDASKGFQLLGSAEFMAMQQMDNLEGDVTYFKSALEGAQIALSDKLTPSLRTFVQTGTAGLSEFASKLKKGDLIGAADSIGEALGKAIATGIKKIPSLFGAGAALLKGIVDGIIKSAPSVVKSLSKSIPKMFENLMGLFDNVKVDGGKIAGKAKELLQQVLDAIDANGPTLIQKGLEFLAKLSGSIRENFGMIVSAVLEVIVHVAQAIADALPAIIENIPTIISNIAGLINDNAPKIVVAAVRIIAAIAVGLVKAIPTLIANIPKILKAIWDAFMAFNWLALGKQIIVAIVNGIKSLATSMPSLLKGIGTRAWNALKSINWLSLGKSIIQLIGKGISALARLPFTLMRKAASLGRKAFTGIAWGNVGKNIIRGIVRGITAIGDSIARKLLSIVKGAWKAVTGWLQERSPSRRFMKVGKNIGLGMAIGIDNTTGEVEDAMAGMYDAFEAPDFDAVVPEITTEPVGYPDESAWEVLATPDTVTSTRNDEPRDVTVILQLDRTQLARTVFRLNNEETQRVGVNLAGGFA